MNAIAQERFGPADVLRFVETDLPDMGTGEVLKPAHGATVSPPVSPHLRGAAYAAALEGDPWRPRV